MKKSKTLQINLLVIFLLLVPLTSILLIGVDRYKHARERQKAFASLAELGLNHEFESTSSAGSLVSFYSTTSRFDPTNASDVLRHLKTVSSKYNGMFRFGYGIQRLDFKNSEPDPEFIEELQATFPKAEITSSKSGE